MDVNYGSISGQVVEYGYTGAYTGGGVTYPYELTSHGAADPNSIMADANFATTGTVELRIVSDFDPAKMVVDWQEMSDSQLWRDDINALDAVTVNATSDATDSAVIGWKTPGGTEGTFTATVSIVESVADTSPDPFTVTPLTGQALDALAEFAPIEVTGIDADESIAVTVTGTDVEYAVDAGAGYGGYTATSTNVQLGDFVKPRIRTANDFETAATGSISIGGESSSLSATTRAAVLPTQDATLPDLNLGETDTGSLDLDNYFSGASSYTLTGIPTDSGFSFSGSILSWNTNAIDVSASPFTLTATAISADGSINDAFSVTVVDDIGPNISIFPLTTLDTTPIVSGSAGDATSLTLVVDGVTYNPTPSGGSWSQQLPTLALGTYEMTLNGQDAVGNAATQKTATLRILDTMPVMRRRPGFHTKMSMGF